MAKKLIDLEFVSCDLCGSERFVERYKKPDTWLWQHDYEFSVVECMNCGLVFLDPRPTNESMSQFYPHDYHENRDSKIHHERYKNQYSYLGNINNHGKMLDIGCARGDWLNFFYDKHPYWELYGCDTFSKKVNYENITFTNAPLPSCNYKSNYFDMITAWAVFEHLYEPIVYFTEVNRILKRGGSFIFLVTNSESLYGKYSDVEDIPRHTYYFSEKTLLKYAGIVGMNVEEVVYSNEIFDGRGYKNIEMLFRRMLGISYLAIKNKRINRLQSLTIKLAHFFDKLLNKINLEKNKPTGIMICHWKKT